MEYENKIKEKVTWFFDLINRQIIQNYYIKDLQNWDALCASLHLLNDLQRPKEEYYKLKSINHIEIIGIMQTLYIEQDTIQSLTNALLEETYSGFKLNNYNRIRDLRNKIFGHPSDKQVGKLKTRHFFDIKDSTKQVIKHIYWGTEREIESDVFYITELVLENSKNSLIYLESLENKFKAKLKKMMTNYKISFEDVFKGANYTFEKLLTKENDRFVIDPYEDTIDSEITRIEKGLYERNINEEYERELNVLKFLSSKLKSLFYVQTYKDIEFYTYASTLSEKIRQISRELKKMDKETFAD
jgi:hypothetical protein